MKADIINPFLTSAMDILKTEAKTEVNRGNISLADARWTTQEVTVMISVIGTVEGTFQVGLSEDTSINITSVMLGEQVPEFNKWVLSAMGELGNIIAGQALAKLEYLGYLSDIGPPTILYGKPARVSTLDRKKLQIPLETSLGLVEISVCLKEKENKESKLEK